MNECPACEINELPDDGIMCSECREYYERQKVVIVLGDVFDKYEEVA